MKIKLCQADIVFSQYIRTRDKWRCVRCGKQFEVGSQGLQNSHYFGRGKESTRFEPTNCDAICFGCHMIWGSRDRESYRNFKIKQLGQDGFDKLLLKSNTYCKKDRKLALIIAKELLKNL